jgi:hypothetical protein
MPIDYNLNIAFWYFKLLPKLREQGISDAKVSVRPAPVMVLLDGRKIIMDSEEKF